MNDDTGFLIHRVDCIAGKPPLTSGLAQGHQKG